MESSLPETLDSSLLTNQERLDSVKGDQKQTWKIANDMLHRDGKSKPETADPVVSRKLCSDFKSFFLLTKLKTLESTLLHVCPSAVPC